MSYCNRITAKRLFAHFNHYFDHIDFYSTTNSLLIFFRMHLALHIDRLIEYGGY